MKTEEEINALDKLIGKSLLDSGYPEISPSFTERLMVKINRRLAWQTIMEEFFWKAVMVLVLLLFGAGVLFLPAFRDFLKIITGLSQSWQMIAYPAILVGFTLIFDQLVLKFLFSRRNP